MVEIPVPSAHSTQREESEGPGSDAHHLAAKNEAIFHGKNLGFSGELNDFPWRFQGIFDRIYPAHLGDRVHQKLVKCPGKRRYLGPRTHIRRIRTQLLNKVNRCHPF